MRISDWSSDVCSSDLRPGRIAVLPGLVTLDNHLIRSSSDVRNGCGKTTADKCFRTVNREGKPFFSKDRDKVLAEVVAILRADLDPRILPVENLRTKAERASQEVDCRPEERRGGKECVSTCRSRWSSSH